MTKQAPSSTSTDMPGAALRPRVFAGVSAGFSLVELLVVLIILAILVAITLPSLIGSQPERNLAAASERFGLDIKYAMSVAQNTGNNVYIGFVGDLASGNNTIEPRRNSAGQLIAGPTVGTNDNYRFVNPGNPGLRRIAKTYYIVEERKRWRDEVLVGGTGGGPLYMRSDESRNLIPYTYLDWLNQWDAFQDGRIARRPVEPLFPYAGAPMGSLPQAPADGISFNHTATPRYAYPMRMRGPGDYTSRLSQPVWAVSNRDSQAMKMFCTADTFEILAYDGNPGVRTQEGLRFVKPGDSPRLREQVVDYVLLKEVELPDHVWFINPSRNYWVTDWQVLEGGSPAVSALHYQDMQFIQHLWAFTPRGDVARADWTYDSEGAPNVYVHGHVEIDRGLPQAYCFWMTLEEVIEDLVDGVSDASGSPFSRRKAQQPMSGRIFVVWPLNGQYNVADYTPNDFTTPDLQTQLTLGGNPPGWSVVAGAGGGGYIGNEDIAARRERGYLQNFLGGRAWDDPNLGWP